MSVHQYIGARYVPKFYTNSVDPTSCEWEPNVSYEPLVIVTLPNQHSYISKKAVPDTVGSPAYNPEYWKDTGSYDAYIEALQDEVDNINLKIKALKTWRNRRIVFVGDSLADTDPMDYPYKIRAMGIFKQVDIVAGGGWGFTGKDGAGSGTTGPTLEWLTHFTDYVDSLTDEDKEEITDVFIIGGFNDHYSTSTVIGEHMEEFFEYANAALPDAQFHVGFVGWCLDGDVTTPNETKTGAEIRQILSTVVIPAYTECVKFGAEYMGNFIWGMHNYSTDFDSSKYHATSSAQDKIAKYVLGNILGYDVAQDEAMVPQQIKISGVDKTIGGWRKIGNLMKLSPFHNIGVGLTCSFTADADCGIGGHYLIPTTALAKPDANDWYGARYGSPWPALKCMIRHRVAGETFNSADISIDPTTLKFRVQTPITIVDTEEYDLYFVDSSVSMLDC